METSKTIQHPEAETFSHDTTDLSSATMTETVDLADGDAFELRAAPIRKQLGSTEARMLAYNGSVPGPTLRVRQGSAVTVHFTNHTDLESTVHWHGLRLENAFDGTHDTQAPVQVGEGFSYRLQFPDPGVYWYHPHIREDYSQELGLYGNVLVVPAEPEYWPPVHREILLTLDDILLEDGAVAPFSRSETTYTAMGRFGNVLLVNGEPDLSLSAHRNEVVRFYLTNTANTRVFNVGFTGARMKLVGGDSGRCEQEAFVETVLLAPSERVVVDVLFDQPGEATLEHRTPRQSSVLAVVTISETAATPSLTEKFDVLRRDPELVAERQHLEPYLTAPADKTLAFVAEMNLDEPAADDGPVVYSCPMHPEVASAEPGSCPLCGMKLLPSSLVDGSSHTSSQHGMTNEGASGLEDHQTGHHHATHERQTRHEPQATTYTCPMHPAIVSAEPGRCPKCGMTLLPASPDREPGQASASSGATMHADDGMTVGDDHHVQHGHSMGHPHHGHHAETQQSDQFRGIEWEDDMVAVNRITTPANTRWKLIDRATGAENHAIDWQFRVGERIKIRLVNEIDSDHPMHHPFHVHGAGRFLVLARDGAVESNLMWKDTVLVRTGETVDILLDVSNPGVWMAHCHIAEHHESGMMLSFSVSE